MRGTAKAALVCGMVCVAVLGPAGGAAARSGSLVFKTLGGETLAPGAPLTLSSSNFQLETSGGARFSCSRATLTGTLENNDAAIVVASFTAGEFVSEPLPGCRFEPSLGPLLESEPLAAVKLPWSARFSSNLTAVLAGAEGVGFEEGAVSPCTWLGKRLKGTFEAPLGFLSTPAPLQKLSVGKGQPCWENGPVNRNKATVGAEWALSSEGETVRARIEK